MARQSRKFNPRVRTKRPIGLVDDDDQSPSSPHPMPQEIDSRWFLPNPLGARLHQKSGIGLVLQDGIALDPIEVLFCCLLYTSPSPRDGLLSRMPSSA